MPHLVICNANARFSLSMIVPTVYGGDSRVSRDIGEDGARALIKEFQDNGQEIVSAVGHENTAAVFSGQLNYYIQANRAIVNMEKKKTILLVGQYSGPRLEEGAVELPEGATIKWHSVQWVS